MEQLTQRFLLTAEIDIMRNQTITMENWGVQLLDDLNRFRFHILPEATNFRQLPTAD